MTVLDFAKDYMDHGYWVIPTIRADKKPAIPWKTYQTEKPTYDDLECWFSEDRNIAVICGAGSGVVVIDADDKDAERWVRESCLPTPFRVRTRKGCHYYYRHPGAYVQSKARVIPGIAVDVRGDGGLATGLGSIHETGHIYCLDGNCDMVSVRDLPVFDPGWFPRPVVAVQREKIAYEGIDKFDRATRYISKIDGAGKGNRNQSAFQVAAAVVRDFDLDFDQGMTLLAEWGESCDPPMDPREIADVVRSSLRAGRRPPGSKLNQS